MVDPRLSANGHGIHVSAPLHLSSGDDARSLPNTACYGSLQSALARARAWASSARSGASSLAPCAPLPPCYDLCARARHRVFRGRAEWPWRALDARCRWRCRQFELCTKVPVLGLSTTSRFCQRRCSLVHLHVCVCFLLLRDPQAVRHDRRLPHWIRISSVTFLECTSSAQQQRVSARAAASAWALALSEQLIGESGRTQQESSSAVVYHNHEGNAQLQARGFAQVSYEFECL